eukprot:TRINITY_DN42937_c0_g1_i1.p2 TRINITY_DN42937_c0_g1~~TRINITY_DN42937_c0_g1_i1.p2  ORF type:complete len:277 (-),score=43.28 TRINITY_DN42937_c0_g1_i1:36-866(-)
MVGMAYQDGMRVGLCHLGNAVGKGAFWLSCMFWLFGFLICQPAAAGELRIEYHDYLPFYGRNDDGKLTGFLYEIVTEALGRIGVEARWDSYPWSRCQADVKHGAADALVTVPTVERLRYTVTHPAPLYMKGHKIYTYARHPRLEAIKAVKSIDDIARENLVVLTYHGNGWNDKHIRSRGIKIYESPKLKNIWLMLANKRGDIVIEWPGAVWSDIQAAGMSDKIVDTGVLLDAVPFHLMISRKSPFADILPQFNAVVLQMQGDGTVEGILRKYGAKQ